MAAKGFTVQLRVPAAPGYCKSFFDHQLDARQAHRPAASPGAKSERPQPGSVAASQAVAAARCAGSIWWPTSDSR